MVKYLGVAATATWLPIGAQIAELILAKPAIPFAPGAGAVKVGHKEMARRTRTRSGPKGRNCGRHHMTRSALIIYRQRSENIPRSGRWSLQCGADIVGFGNKGLCSKVL
jgi:hypothetical protein